MDDVQTLGKYELRGVLGKGAMGTVYDGWDPRIGRRVAIKTVTLPDNPDPQTEEEIARFRREAQAAGALSHPNIVAVYDYGETADQAYIVMEFVGGPSLKSLLDKEERFPIATVATLMEQLLAGLHFSHSKGVVHRDIKPANVMLTTDRQVKIADFGIARIEQSSMTQAGTMMGTPAYMSPEQFMGQTVDARTDVYSSGILLYQLLTGERPFEGSLTTIMQKVLNTAPLPPSQLNVSVPLAMDEVVLKAIAKRPGDRFATAADFARAVRAAVDGAPAGLPAQDTLDDLLGGGDEGATVIRRPGPAAGVEATGTRRPAPAPAPAPAVAPSSSAHPSGAPPSGAPKKSQLPLFAGIGVGAVAVLGIGGYLLFGGSPAPLQPPAAAPTAPATAAQAPAAPATAAQAITAPATAAAPSAAAPSAASTPAAAATAQAPAVQAPAVPAVHAPVAQAPVAQAPVAQAPVAQAPVAQAPAVQAPPAVAAPAVAPAVAAASAPAAVIAAPPPSPVAAQPVAGVSNATPAATPAATPSANAAGAQPSPAAAGAQPSPAAAGAQPSPAAAAAPPPATVTAMAETPVAAPPAPAGPTTEQLTALVATALAQARCSVASATVPDTGPVQLAGISGDPLSLQANVGNAIGNARDVEWFGETVKPALCRALDVIHPVAVPQGATTLTIDLGGRGGAASALREDELIQPHVTMPEFGGYLRMDYVANDGTIAHLAPFLPDTGGKGQKIAAQPQRLTATRESVLLGKPGRDKTGAELPTWTVGEPFGTDMIFALASSGAFRPLATTNYEDDKGSAAYLTKLATEIERLQRAGAKLTGTVILVHTQKK